LAVEANGGGGNRNGYTGFVVRIDPHLRYGSGAVNNLALRSDASFGSGHWYEGGGIYRDVSHRCAVFAPMAPLFHLLCFVPSVSARSGYYEPICCTSYPMGSALTRSC
jgi:hypothetical protein